MLAGLGGDGRSDDDASIFESDHSEFLVKGVPNLLLWNDADEYFKIHHKPGDTFDKVDKHTLAEGAAIVATTAYAIADSETFAPHLFQPEIEELLRKDKKYDEYVDLKDHGLL